MESLLVASLDQCSLSKRQIEAIAKEGYLTITNFLLNRYTDIESFTKKLQALLPERGGVCLGHMHVLRLKAFLYWLKNQSRWGIDLYDPREDFGQYKLHESIKALETYKDLEKAKDSKTTAPDKFQLHLLHGWTSFN